MTVVYREPLYDVAQLGHIELKTPDLESSAKWFSEVYGLSAVEEEKDRVHLRAWGDDVLSSLTLVAADQAGLGHVGWRTMSPQALDRRVAAIEASGLDGRWVDDSFGHGKAYRFTAVGGHEMEIYFETEKFVAPPGQEPALPNQPQRYAPHGAGASRIDHLNLLVPDVPASRKFQEEALGFKLRERLVPTPENEVGAWLSLMTKAHDLALTREPTDTDGRLHHLAYAVESREEVLRAADIFIEQGTTIEVGPAKHSRTQGFFLYVYEPGGNRVEVFAGGIHIHTPDWEPVTWNTESGGRGSAWGTVMPDSFSQHATPPYPA